VIARFRQVAPAAGISWCLALAVLAWLLWLHLALLRTPGIIAPVEAAYVNNINLMLKGGNPYTLEHLPEHTQVYGLGYNLAMFCVAPMVGSDLPALRLVNMVLLYVSAALLFVTLRRVHLRPLWAAWATVLWLSQMLRDPTLVYAGPDVLGTLLFLSAILLPLWIGMRTWTLATAILLAIGAFHVKMYFSVPAVCLISYVFLFVSQRRGILLGVSALAVLGLSAGILDGYFPYYRLLCIDFIFLWVAPTLVTWWKFVIQNTSYARINGGLLVLTAAMVIERYCVWSGRGNPGNGHAVDRGQVRSATPAGGRVELRRWSKPLLTVRVGYLEWCAVSAAAAVLYLGAAETETRFYHEMLTPLLLLCVLPWAQDVKGWAGRLGAQVALASCLFLSNVQTTGRTNYEINISQLNQLARSGAGPYRDSWEQWSALLRGARSSHVPEELSPITLSNGSGADLAGHSSEYFLIAAQAVGDSVAVEHYQRYARGVHGRLLSKEYEVVVLRSASATPYFTPDELRQHYYLSETREFVCNQGSYDMEVWLPLGSHREHS
jgi:hypothetical protein